MRPKPEDDFEEWIIGERALAGALERVEAARQSTPAVEIAATEGIWWCSALEEWHKARLGEGAYYALRKEAGGVIAGMVWARNLAAHQLTIVPRFVKIAAPKIPFAESWDEDLGAAVSTGLQRVDIRWPLRDQLPAPEKPEQHGRDLEYDHHVAVRTLTETLEDALQFFAEEVWR